MSITISSGAESIIKTLSEAGFEAYIVGGAVRDFVMGNIPHDYDIATNARPEQVKKVFRKVIETGISHGTVMVIEGSQGYEVTTFRTEKGYTDGRHPDKVEFIGDIKEDLMRRDFTINAMCFNPETGIGDYFGGREDIKNKLIRTVGNPEERFFEDGLRMLRAIRFAAVLGFELEENTEAAIAKCAAGIRKISAERILGEMNKILLSDNPMCIRKMHSTGLLKYIMPELDICFDTPQKNKYHVYNVGEHILHAVDASEKNLVLRWAALLHDIGKPSCMSRDANGIIHFYGHHRDSMMLGADVLRRLRMDGESTKEILALIENHDVRIEATPPAVKRMLAKLGDKLFLQLLSLQIADNRAKNAQFIEEKLKKIEEVRRVYENVVAEGQPYLLSDLVVNGRDLIKLGFKAGREIGDVLKTLLGEVVITPELNNRTYLLRRAKELKRKR